MILGLFIGESFAELSVVESQGTAITKGKKRPLLEHKRWYLPKQSLKSSLEAWLSQSAYKPERVIVSSRFPLKLAGHRLGGSVAQIVTQGFEKWSQFSMPEKTLDLRAPQRIQSLSSQELIFPINEKISSQGQVEKPLTLNELELIHEKLKPLEIKKICVHFVNAAKNPVHQQQATGFFRELGYEVFLPKSLENSLANNEFAQWKTNTLNAAITGTFEELKIEIADGLAASVKPENIFFFDAELNVGLGDSESRLSTLFSFEACLVSQIKKLLPNFVSSSQDPFSIMHLGLEHFSWIQNLKKLANSPWGPLAFQAQSCSDFQTQPTSIIEISEHHELNILSPQTYEPGPVRLGRGLKPLIADLFSSHIPLQKLAGLDEKQLKSSTDRWKMILQTWQRAHRYNNFSTETFEKLIFKEALQKLNQEIRSITNEPLVLYGFFATDITLSPLVPTLISEADYPKSYLVACEALDRGF